MVRIERIRKSDPLHGDAPFRPPRNGMWAEHGTVRASFTTYAALTFA